MNYYREQYYKYFNQKLTLITLRELARPKDHAVTLKNIQQQIAILQLKIELCDERATKEGMKEFKSKNYLSLKESFNTEFVINGNPVDSYPDFSQFTNYKVTNV